MFNGRKNTVIGLTAIFTFVLVELAAMFPRSRWCFSSPSTWMFRFFLPATTKAASPSAERQHLQMSCTSPRFDGPGAGEVAGTIISQRTAHTFRACHLGNSLLSESGRWWAHELTECSWKPAERWRTQMRKFILITSFALMSTSSCFANLSLASNEAPQTLVRQSVASVDASQAEPKPQTTQVRPDIAIRQRDQSKKPRENST